MPAPGGQLFKISILPMVEPHLILSPRFISRARHEAPEVFEMRLIRAPERAIAPRVAMKRRARPLIIAQIFVTSSAGPPGFQPTQFLRRNESRSRAADPRMADKYCPAPYKTDSGRHTTRPWNFHRGLLRPQSHPPQSAVA